MADKEIIVRTEEEYLCDVSVSEKFAMLNKLKFRDKNRAGRDPSFYLYTREKVAEYIKNPYRYETELRRSMLYIYSSSPHFRRLIQYFVGLTDLAYIVSPYRIDPQKTKPKSIQRNYRKVLDRMSAMRVRSQIPKILTICLREDICYCTFRETADDITIQILPSDYCSITTIEGGVPNVTFDFSYFDAYQQYLDYYPPEFTAKYNAYKKDMTIRYQELDAPNSFAIKANDDVLEYAVPPFVGLLREVYDLEDYKTLKGNRTALENYAMLDMRLPMDDEGNWVLSYDKAKDFWRNLDSVLPDEVGSILSPMDVNKISFERTNTSKDDTVAEAEQSLFTAAGVSSLLFNNEKASASALLLSIKADQSITFRIVKNIEDAINRFVQAQSFGKNFKVTFLDVSPFNRDEYAAQLIKGIQYGLPLISAYAAVNGLSQAELDTMTFLEVDVLKLAERMRPLQSANTQGAVTDSNGQTDEGGAPTKPIGELTDGGEKTRESNMDR